MAVDFSPGNVCKFVPHTRARAKPHLLHGNYLYSDTNVPISKTGTRYWKCSNNDCPATAHTKVVDGVDHYIDPFPNVAPHSCERGPLHLHAAYFALEVYENCIDASHPDLYIKILTKFRNQLKSDQDRDNFDAIIAESYSLKAMKAAMERRSEILGEVECDSGTRRNKRVKGKKKPVKVKRIKVENPYSSDEDDSRNNSDQSSCEVPDSFFEPLDEKPVKEELDPLDINPMKSKLENEFKCKFCQKVMASCKGLTAHLRQAHAIFRTFTCELCGLECPSRWSLEYHTGSSHKQEKVKQVHPEEKVKQKEKMLKCPHCEKKFERQSNLSTHVRSMHKGYSCSSCGLGFTSASNLTVHEVFEQKLVKIPCQLCQVETEVKLNCAMEKTFKDSGMKVKCKDCTET